MSCGSCCNGNLMFVLSSGLFSNRYLWLINLKISSKKTYVKYNFTFLRTSAGPSTLKSENTKPASLVEMKATKTANIIFILITCFCTIDKKRTDANNKFYFQFYSEWKSDDCSETKWERISSIRKCWHLFKSFSAYWSDIF